MKYKLVALALCCMVGVALGAGTDVISQAEDLFEQGDYAEGMGVLSTVLLDEGLSAEQRCDIVGAMGLFHEEFTGNYDEALNCYRRVLKTNLLPGNTAKSSARTNMMRIESLSRKYADENAVLKDLPGDTEKMRQGIGQLERIAAGNPEYYRLGEVYYYLGAGLIGLEEYDKAAECLTRAVKLKPGLGAWLPVESHIEVIERYSKAAFIDRCSWAVIAAYFAVVAMGLLILKPWRWDTGGRWIVGIVLLLILSGVFYVSLMRLGSQIDELRTEEAIEVEHRKSIM